MRDELQIYKLDFAPRKKQQKKSRSFTYFLKIAFTFIIQSHTSKRITSSSKKGDVKPLSDCIIPFHLQRRGDGMIKQRLTNIHGGCWHATSDVQHSH